MEIFSTYGKIKMIDMPVDRLNPHLSKGYAYVEFENPDDAEKALKHMDGGRCQMLQGGRVLWKKSLEQVDLMWKWDWDYGVPFGELMWHAVILFSAQKALAFVWFQDRLKK